MFAVIVVYRWVVTASDFFEGSVKGICRSSKWLGIYRRSEDWRGKPASSLMRNMRSLSKGQQSTYSVKKSNDSKNEKLIQKWLIMIPPLVPFCGLSLSLASLHQLILPLALLPQLCLFSPIFKSFSSLWSFSGNSPFTLFVNMSLLELRRRQRNLVDFIVVESCWNGENVKNVKTPSLCADAYWRGRWRTTHYFDPEFLKPIIPSEGETWALLSTLY